MPRSPTSSSRCGASPYNAHGVLLHFRRRSMAVEPARLPIAELDRLARTARARIIENSHRTETPHLGSCLSCVDILVAAYFHTLRLDTADAKNPDRDRFILFAEHPPTPDHLPGIEAATGSLGHGLPMGLGMALAGRINGRKYNTVVLSSDGECNEGVMWEAAMLAAAQSVERLCVIVDFNRWQATGRSEEIMALAPLAEKWRAFGWTTYETDGHDLAGLVRMLSALPDPSGKPTAIIAHTVKGKGVSFMEDDNNWHYRIPKAEEVAAAKKELGVAA